MEPSSTAYRSASPWWSSRRTVACTISSTGDVPGSLRDVRVRRFVAGSAPRLAMTEEPRTRVDGAEPADLLRRRPCRPSPSAPGRLPCPVWHLGRSRAWPPDGARGFPASLRVAGIVQQVESLGCLVGIVTVTSISSVWSWPCSSPMPAQVRGMEYTGAWSPELHRELAPTLTAVIVAGDRAGCAEAIHGRDRTDRRGPGVGRTPEGCACPGSSSTS